MRLIVGRLVAPVVVVAILLVVSATASAWYVRDIQQRLSWSLTENVASVVAAQELVTSIREVDAGFDRYLITGDRSQLDAVPRLRKQSEDALIEAERWALSPEEKVLMIKVRTGFRHLFDDFDRAMEQPSPAFRGRIEALAVTPESEILEPARQYRKLNEDALARTSRETEELTHRLTIGLLTLGLCGGIGGLLGGWAIATRIWRSIRQTELRLLATAARIGPVPGGERDPAEIMDESVSHMLDRLRASERDALRAEQLAQVGQMAAGVAHEVRNPVASLKLLVQAAADPRRETPFRIKDLEVMEREIARLEHIVSGFLDFARPPQPCKSTFELKSFVAGVLDAWRSRAEKQRVALRAEVPDLRLTADPAQLRQVFDNAIVNAFEAQPAGGRIDIVIYAADADRRGITILIDDSGIGLPGEVTAKMFQPFVSTKETGLGLGLSICKRIIESHGGTVAVSPRPGGGTSFVIKLPVNRG
ncbi:MAG: ATP-binding protein [Gemmataceae bacterium]